MGRIRNSAPARAIEDLYLSQVEQFGIALKRGDTALVGSVSNERVDAQVVVCPLGCAGAVVSHRIRIKRDILFEERGVPGLCVSTLSSDSLALCPVVQSGKPHDEGNVAVFGQGCCERSYPLRAGSVQDAVSITYLPAWFDLREGSKAARARELIDTAGETCVGWPEHALDGLLRSLSPLFGGVLPDERRLSAGAAAAAALAIDWYGERERAERAAGTLEQARLARAARHLVMQHLDENLSLDRIARDLLVSRTRLCAAFRRETGESLGRFISRVRMERAAFLLESPEVSVAEVAHAVGYQRLSSFIVAFERAYGCAPTVWRKTVEHETRSTVS